MITTLLKVNQLFVSAILVGLSLLGLFLLFNEDLVAMPQLISFILVAILFVLAAGYNQVVNFVKKSHFIVFFYLLFILNFLEDLGDISFYSGYFFLSLIFFQMLDGRDFSKKIFNPFDFGFFGCIILPIHPPFIIFFIAIIFHFIMMGRTQVSALTSCFLGILTGTFLWIEIIFIFDLQDFFYLQLGQLGSLKKIEFHESSNYYYFAPILGLSLFSLVDYFQNINRQKTEKKIIFTNILMLLFASAVYLYFFGKSSKNFLVLALPLSLLLSNFSLHGAKVRREIIVWLVVLSFSLYQISQHIELIQILNTIRF